jgi:hypothetical protein
MQIKQSKKKKVDWVKFVAENQIWFGVGLVFFFCGTMSYFDNREINEKDNEKEKKCLTPDQEARLDTDYNKILLELDQSVVIKILQMQSKIENIYTMFENRVHSLCILGYLLEISDMSDADLIKQLKIELDERNKISHEALIELKQYVFKYNKKLQIGGSSKSLGFYERKRDSFDNYFSDHINNLYKTWLSEYGYYKSTDTDSTKRLIEVIAPVIESLNGLYGNTLIYSIKTHTSPANTIATEQIVNRIQIAAQDLTIVNFTLLPRQYLNMIIVLEILQNTGGNHAEWIKYLQIRYNESLAWNEEYKAIKNLEDIKINLDSEIEKQILEKVSQTLEDGYTNVLNCELLRSVNSDKKPEIMAYICCVLWFGSSNIPFRSIRGSFSGTQVNPELHQAMLGMFKEIRAENAKLPEEFQNDL